MHDDHFRAVPSLLINGIVGMFNYTYLWFEPGSSPTVASPPTSWLASSSTRC